MGFLSDMFGPIGLIALLGFFGISLMLGAIAILVLQPEDPLVKLKKTIGKQGERADGNRARSLRNDISNEQLERFATYLEPQDLEELSKLQVTMIQAGLPSKDAVRAYQLGKLLLGLVGLLIGGFYVFVIKAGAEMSMQSMLIYGLIPGVAGFYAPQFWLNRRVKKRQEEIESGFPDSLDMLLVCVEAGRSIEQAITRVADELQSSYPALAQEYKIVAHEMKAGKDKEIVLKDLGTRSGVQDLNSFATVLIQSAAFGTSVGEALRVYSSEMRDKRVMRAEEKANKLPTKMTLATMGLTVPPLMVILVAPSIVNVMNMGALGN